MKKYYILKRANKRLVQDYLMEFGGIERDKIEKRLLKNDGSLLLIEKKIKGDSEIYSNLWLINEGCDSHLEYIKENIMYDYSGIVHPIIHKGKKVMLFDEYQNSL